MDSRRANEPLGKAWNKLAQLLSSSLGLYVWLLPERALSQTDFGLTQITLGLATVPFPTGSVPSGAAAVL